MSWIRNAAALTLAALLPAPMAGQESPPLLPSPLPLAWCLARAEQANPSVAADEAAAQAAFHRIRPAGSLEDPRFRSELVNLPTGAGDLQSTPMSGILFGLSQKLPFPGLLASREAAARAGARAARAQVEDRRRRIRAAVEQAWSELGFAQRALDITDSNLELVRQLAEIAAARYRVGSGRQQDVLRAQVTLTQLLDERLRRRAAIRTAEARLASLLDLPPESRFGRTEELGEKAPLPDLDPVLAHLEEESPRLQALAERVREAERRRRATQLEGYPDFDLGLGYRVRQKIPMDPVQGDDFISAGVVVRLPVNRAKWREKVAERDAELRRARAAYRQERARLRDAARAAFAALARADGQVELLETGLVPQAEQSLESNRAGYQVDKVDFLSLIDSQVSLLDAELRRLRAVADRREAFAALEAALGKELR